MLTKNWKSLVALCALALRWTPGTAMAVTWTPGNNSGDSTTWDTSSANWSGGVATLWDGPAASGLNNTPVFNTADVPNVSGTIFTKGIDVNGTMGISGGTITLEGNLGGTVGGNDIHVAPRNGHDQRHDWR